MAVALPPWELVVGADEGHLLGVGGVDDETVEGVFVLQLLAVGDALAVKSADDRIGQFDDANIPLRK